MLPARRSSIALAVISLKASGRSSLRIRGDYFTVLGLPLLPLIGFLRDHGVPRHNKKQDILISRQETPHDDSPYHILRFRNLAPGRDGIPVSHSKSPRLHGYWLAKCGIDGSYMPLPVEPNQAALMSLRNLGFSGVITVPQEMAMPECDELIAPGAGAVNTVTFSKDGRFGR